MKLKFSGFFIILIILTAACAPSAAPEPTATVPATAVNTIAAPSEVPSPVPATKAVSSPKQRDLLFVEFFAVT